MRYQFSTDPEYEGHAPARAHSQHSPPGAGRFAETPAVPAIRRFYRVLCRLAPSLAAQLAYRQLARPPRAVMGRWHAALRVGARSRRLSCGAHQLEVYEWGRGPTVLLVHGWGSNAMHMGRLVSPLVLAGFRVVAFDAPAHGRSSGRTTDMVEFASAVATVARHSGPLHAVIGHSFGAAMALFAARDWGMATTRFVLISSFSHCAWFVSLFAEHMALSTAVQERVRDIFVERYNGRFDWERMSVVEMARQARLPALLVHDEGDVEVPFEHSLALAAALPGAQLKATRGLGHHRVLRNAEVIRRLVAFVSS